MASPVLDYRLEFIYYLQTGIFRTGILQIWHVGSLVLVNHLELVKYSKNPEYPEYLCHF